MGSFEGSRQLQRTAILATTFGSKSSINVCCVMKPNYAEHFIGFVSQNIINEN
jgi:hypothetical protein